MSLDKLFDWFILGTGATVAMLLVGLILTLLWNFPWFIFVLVGVFGLGYFLDKVLP